MTHDNHTATTKEVLKDLKSDTYVDDAEIDDASNPGDDPISITVHMKEDKHMVFDMPEKLKNLNLHRSIGNKLIFTGDRRKTSYHVEVIQP
jgi:hypothetical protein